MRKTPENMTPIGIFKKGKKIMEKVGGGNDMELEH